MDLNRFDIDEQAAPNGLPGLLHPCEINAPVNEQMKMRVSILLKFQHSNVLRNVSQLTLQVDSKFCEYIVQVCDRITLDF